jgi:AAA family ATP:ADP antiporter
MLLRVRRFFDVRSGEGLPVLLSFLYVAFVVAAYLLAKPIRNSLFLKEYGPYALTYVYASVPIVLWVFISIYTRLVGLIGTRRVAIGTLMFFSLNVVAFWYAFTFAPNDWLPGVFYVWVNCFGVIAPVQAWGFANSLFDVRQARRLFGLIGAGASLGSITGGLLARFLVGPVGGTTNLLLVLAALILTSAVLVVFASRSLSSREASKPRVRSRTTRALSDSLSQIRSAPYLRLIAALVFLVAVTTQWTNFQLSLVATERFGKDADRLVAFFGTFNFILGAVGFLLQLFVTGPLLRRFGVPVAVLLLPFCLFSGSALTLAAPVFLSVLFTNAADYGLRFSVDKAGYELLYLPIPPAQRQAVKNAIDIVVNRIADAAGGVLLGVATKGFILLPGMGLGLRGTAAVTVTLSSVWILVGWRIRSAYVKAIGDSIHRYRLDSEQSTRPLLDKSVSQAIATKLSSAAADDVRYALDILAMQPLPSALAQVRGLLTHADAEVRRRAVAALAAAGDQASSAAVRGLLKDPSPGVRTEALLYLARRGDFDPLQTIEQLGDFEGFSIRASMAAFLGSPGRAHNPEAAAALLEAMSHSDDPRDRIEAAKVLAMILEPPLALLDVLLADADAQVWQQALHAAEDIGNDAVPVLSVRLSDRSLLVDVRREIPPALMRIGTESAERALISGLMDADSAVRHRVIAALNKLKQQQRRPGGIDTDLLELLLAAEIAGHYRSYQLLGALRASEERNEAVIAALQVSMEQELERIFRLIALVSPDESLHDAYVGVRSTNKLVRANALEYLEHILKPELRHVLLPLIDSQVEEAERIRLANTLVGAPVASPEQALGTLLVSEDPWLRSRAEYAWQRLAGDQEPMEHAPAPADMSMHVGAG